MSFEFKKRNLVCIFPGLIDITAIKCTGQICNTIAEKYDVNSYIVTYKNEEYPKFQKYCPNTKLLFLEGQLNDGGLKLFYDLLCFVIKYAKKINILYLYQFPDDYLLTPAIGYIYKRLNKNGILFVRLEADIETLPPLFPYITRKGIKNIIKNSVIKYFYSAINILGVADNRTFDLSRERIIWKLAADKFKIQLNGYRFFENNIVKEFRKKEKIILLAGRLNSYQKGLDVFIGAMKLLNLRGWKITLLGEIRQDQINEIREIEEENSILKGNIEILGYIDDVSVYSQMLNDSMVFCLPSRYDGIPLVIPDAMARGCVIVGSDLFGIKDIITNYGEFGFYFQNGNSEALAKLLNEIISGEYDLERISQKGQKRAQEIFQWDSIVEGLHLEEYIENF